MTLTKAFPTLDISKSASYGGIGWKGREKSHKEELGKLWTACGVSRETDELKHVILSFPSYTLENIEQEAVDENLFFRKIDLQTIRDQMMNLTDFYESNGVGVSETSDLTDESPNLIFMRDTFFMTPEGVILSRMASKIRENEEAIVQMTMAELKIPILGRPTDTAIFEGADALWLNENTVLVGVGHRTNPAGYDYLSNTLGRMGVQTIKIILPTVTQHLLGVVNFVDKDLVTVFAEKASSHLLEILKHFGYDLLMLESTDEVVNGRAMNFVTLKPREIVMPADCPNTKKLYEDVGVKVHEVDVSEYIAAAGAIGCVTGIVHREPVKGSIHSWSI